MKGNRIVRAWLLVGCAMITIMVLIGGITRLTDSGLSITEWEVIKGTIPPTTEEAWEEAFDKYKQIPEYSIRHAHFTLQDFKWIYFWEYIHRLWGRLMGFVFIIPFIWFWVKGYLNKELKLRGFFILLGGAAVGSLGWFMVSSGLSERADVSHYRLAIHLIAAFSLFSYVYWTYLKLGPEFRNQEFQYPSRFKSFYMLGIAFLGLQIIYGAFVAGMDAGLMYNTWPLMNGSFVPENFAPFEGAWNNLTNHKDTIQFIHRNFALLLAGITIWIAIRLRHINPFGTPWLKLILVVLFQVSLGIITLLDARNGDISVFWGSAHQIGALALLIVYLQGAFILWGKRIKVNP
ncbi:MAG: COX15/CtaA family protein [Luteibaculum sp.]